MLKTDPKGVQISGIRYKPKIAFLNTRVGGGGVGGVN